MSADGDSDGTESDSPGRREVAYRLFAAEFEDSDFEHAESDDERAPNYVVTPTGARVNRLFAVGVLTEVQPAGEDILRARIADPTGTFVVYAGQYQPDAQTFLERAEPPAYVAVTGKARTFQPEDSDVVYTSIRPESLNEVEEVTRDRWTVRAAEATLERVGTMAKAMTLDARGEDLRTTLEEQGVEPGLAAGISLAIEHYGTTPGYLAAMRTLAVSALEVVAGERDAVEAISLAPDEGGDADLEALAETAQFGDGPQAITDATAEADTETSADTTADAEPATTDEDSTIEADEVTPEASSTEAEEAPVKASSGEADSEATTAETTETAEPATPTDEQGATDTEVGDSESTPSKESAGTEPGAEASSPDESRTGESSEDAADLGDFDGEFELDESEREEIKAEFGTEFTSGTEVEEPGAADIDTPDEPIEPDSKPKDAEDTTPSVEETTPSEPATESDVESATETTAADPDTERTEAESEIDLEDAAMDAIAALDDGDGADRAAVIERVRDDHGVDTEAVEDAIQAALMNGRCYEPGDDRLKSI